MSIFNFYFSCKLSRDIYHSPFSLVTGVLPMNDSINISIPERQAKHPPLVEKAFFSPHNPGAARDARAGEKKAIEGMRKN